MQVIRHSPEHHFLTFLETLGHAPQGWAGCHLALSETCDHETLIARLDDIGTQLDALHVRNAALTVLMEKTLAGVEDAVLYPFSDGDLIALARPLDGSGIAVFREALEAARASLSPALCHAGLLERDLYHYRKLADRKILGAARIRAYEAMADRHRVHSLSLRRTRRDEPLVLVAEDDRFTAAQVAGILHDAYDITVARTGEEAIALYIEHAPDAALLDIHLPGLDGVETLAALCTVDPAGFIIMLSVDTVRQTVLSADRSGAAAFLKKPIGRDRLLAAVGQSPHIRTLRHRAGAI